MTALRTVWALLARLVAPHTGKRARRTGLGIFPMSAPHPYKETPR